MGKLTDITAQATNTPKPHLCSSPDYRATQNPATMGKENVGKSKSPHFMTPTLSSSKQFATSSRLKGLTPSPEPVRPVKIDGMMKTAAKRVGFRRGIPRSKKEGLATQAKAISFPDKFATPSRDNTSDSPPSAQKQISGPSPKDKPLPSPPIAQLCSSMSSTLSSHSLLDATEKPLRRSPTGQGDHEEEWPVLQPRRPSNTGTLQEVMRESGAELKNQAASAQQERYPVLGNTTMRQMTYEDQLPVSMFSAQRKASQKDSPMPDVQKQSNEERIQSDEIHSNEKKSNPRQSVDDPFRDGIYNTDLTNPSNHKVTSPSTPLVSQPTIQPRQNRTSVLRARLSAGQTVSDRQSKELGLTEPAASDGARASIDHKDSVRARERAAPRSITPPVMQSLRTKGSRDSIPNNRAPAKFVAGSRRPSHPHRPSSRGSLRDESRPPSPPQPYLPPPSRAAPVIPGASQVSRGNVAGKRAVPENNQRMSSIPVSRNTTAPEKTNRGIPNGARMDRGKVKPVEVKSVTPKKEARIEKRIYDDHSSQEFIDDLEGTPPSRPSTNRLVPFLLDNKDARVLEAIEESPQHAYQTKRLSMTSPDYGPTLKISPSAERFIMGSSPKERSRRATKKSSKESLRAKPQLTLKTRKSGTSSTSSTENMPKRPSSSQGLSRLGSRIGLIDPAVREKKVKSAEIRLLSPEIHNTHDANAIQQLSESARGSAASSSTAAYYFDAPERIAARSSKESTTNVDYDDELSAASEKIWISPLKPKANGSLGLQKNIPTQIAIHKEHSNPFEDSKTNAQDFAEQPNHETDETAAEVPPSTPRRDQGKPNANSSSLPPRSSSRMAPPDWTGTPKSPSPPVTAEKIFPPTPPKQKNHGQRPKAPRPLRSHGPSQSEVKTVPSKQNSLRESLGHDSLKSQASASLPKGNSVLSNLKGLFHKRSLENERFKSKSTITRNGSPKAKASVTRNGSPNGPYPAYPPITEIHPVHRPTLASTSRAKTSTPIPKHPTANATLNTPALASSTATELDAVSTMAMEVLDAARTETSSPKREQLFQLGRVFVATITQAREAEKAMMEARQAARDAEVANVLCRQSLGDVHECLKEWKRVQSLDWGS